MNDFEQRWKTAAGLAGRTETWDGDVAPYGFATRVVARWLDQPVASISPAHLWHALTLRLLQIVAILVVVLVLASYMWPGFGGGDAFGPPIGDTVADIFWLL